MKNRVPILDAGHGGMIDGVYATGNKKRYTFQDGYEVYEGVINRAIAQNLSIKLKEAGIPFFDFNIYDNNDLNLGIRTYKINEIYAANPEAYLISIHNNSASASTSGGGNYAKGTEIWTSKGETMSDILVPYFHNIFPEFFPFRTYRKDWKTGDIDKESNFWIICKTLCPAMLFEIGFFDNYSEVLELLQSKAGIDRTTNWLLKGIKTIYESDI